MLSNRPGVLWSFEEDLLQNNNLEFSSDPHQQISGSLNDSGSISDSSSDDGDYPPTFTLLVPLTGNLESISIAPFRKSEPYKPHSSKSQS
jgi:hypothetical protein